MEQEPKDASDTKRTRYKSAFRNRRRADRLSATDLRAVQAGFEIRRNSEDVGRDHLLPRPEVIDGVLIGHGAQLRFVCDQIRYIRERIGMPMTSAQGPFLLEKGGEPNVRQFIQERRKTA